MTEAAVYSSPGIRQVGLLAERIVEDRGLSPVVAQHTAAEYVSIRNAVAQGNAEIVATSPSKHGLQYPGQEKFWIDSILLFKGLPTVIFSRNGQGKTHLLSWASLRAAVLHPNWDILNNIPYYWVGEPELDSVAMPHFITIDSMYSMLRQAALSVLNDRVPALLIDEMDHAITSQSWRSDPNISWSHFTYFERHLEIRGPPLVYHSWSDIPYYMRKGGVVNQHLWVSIHTGKRYAFNTYTRPYYLHVAGPYIPYSTHGAIGFKTDVDMGRLHSLVHATRRLQVAEQILDNVDSCILENDDYQEGVSWEDRVEEADEWARNRFMQRLSEGLEIKEILEEVPVSMTAAYQIKRVWIKERLLPKAADGVVK